MAKKIEIPNVIRMNPSSKSEKRKMGSPFSENEIPDELVDIYKKYMSALKIIIISGLTEATDFLSNYDNYVNVSGAIEGAKENGKLYSKDIFEKNPIDCWTELIVAIMMILLTFPRKSGISIEGITSYTSNYEGDKNKTDYYILSLPIVTESYDWKSHLLEVFIPKDGSKNRIIVLIDNIPNFVTTLHHQ